MSKFSVALMRMLILGALLGIADPAAAQKDYPNKPIRLIVPYATGGSTDPLARLLGQKLSESWGQQVAVDNRPGGNTIIGTEALAKSPADGYTLIMVLATHVILPYLYNSLPYDAIKDFAPVATFAMNEQVMVLHPSVPANNLREFIALAKAKPGQLNYSSSGSGGVNHLAEELFCILAGIKVQHVPYKGGGPALADLVAGQVQMYFGPPIIVIPFIKSGRIKAIAVSGEHRLSALPQVPTFTEAGLPGLDAKVWYGILAPAGTPKDIIDKLSVAIAKILATTDVKEKLVLQGMEPFSAGPGEFAALLKADMAKFGTVIKTANIKIE